MSEHTHCHTHQGIRLGKNLKIVGGLFLGLFLLSFLPYLEALNTSLISYIQQMWWAVALGLIIGGMIDYFVPDGFIYRYLGRRGLSSLGFSVIAGFLMSACSHGILAIAIQLYKKGASIPSVITFLLASPWANLPLTILMFGFFGLQAFWIILGAMVIALITGLIFMVLEHFRLIEPSKQPESGHQEYRWDRITNFDGRAAAHGVSKGTMNLANMTLWWILIGFMLAAIIQAYVPTSYFTSYLGGSIGLVLTLLVATVIEVCSEGSAPLAFELFNKLGTLAHPFVFLMAGVVTDYTEIGLLWTNIGKRTALWLPIVTVPQVLLLGWLFLVFL